MESDPAAQYARKGAALADRQCPTTGNEQGGTMRSFREVVKRNEAHCLEAVRRRGGHSRAAWLSAVAFDLESIDLLDHVIFVFQKKGRWGSIARSRDIGLQGRKPVFRSLRQLVWSYFDPYIDMTGRIKGYGLTSLYDLGNTIGVSTRGTCTRLKIICVQFRTRSFAHPIVATITGTNVTRNTKSVSLIARLRITESHQWMLVEGLAKTGSRSLVRD